MSSIEFRVLQTFLERLAANDQVNNSVVDGLRKELLADKLPKADRLAEIFTIGSGDILA